MAASQFEQAQSYAVYAVWLLISIPATCYISYQLKDNWNEEWLNRRRRVLILTICILLFYSILIECPWYTLARLDIFQDNIVLIIQIEIVHMLVRYWMFAFIVLRIYLLYYDHEYNRTVCNHKWKILINPRQLSRQQTWFLANRHTKYGDERWIISRILVPLALTYSIIYAAVRISVTVYLDVVDDYHNSFYLFWDTGCTVVWGVSCSCVSTFFWRKYPKFADTWLIRKEITILLILLGSALASVPLFSVFQLIFSVPLSQFGTILFSIFMTLILFVMVMYPQSAETRKRRALKEKITQSEALQISWQALISTKQGYETFMEFLGNELSTENLLFITEYVQVKVAMLRKETLAHKIEHTDLNLEYRLELPDKLPMSAIATEFTDKINAIDMTNDGKVNAICWGAMNRIYVKYIHADLADLAVNISSRRRTDIERVYENTKKEKTVENIMGSMERCVIEISQLLNDSRSRFVDEIEFAELAMQITKTATETDNDGFEIKYRSATDSYKSTN
eukprot:450078_1